MRTTVLEAPRGSTFVAVPTCPVCGAAGGRLPSLSCPDCDTPHHRDCWEFNGGCAIYGCASVHRLEVCDPKGTVRGARVPAIFRWSTGVTRWNTAVAVGDELADRFCAWLTVVADGTAVGMVAWVLVLTWLLRQMAGL